MKTHLWIIAMLLAASVNLRAEPEIKGTPSELTKYLDSIPKPVSLTGVSELKIAADRALISLKVVTENKSLQEALHSNQELRAKILNTLKERGLPEDRIKPSKFSSTPKYRLFGDKAKSYRVENVIKITAQDEKEFQTVAKLVDAMPEVRYDSIEFEHSDKDGLKAKALAQAIDKATEKRRLYEEKLGVKLSPKQFVEGGAAFTIANSNRTRYASANKSAYIPSELTSGEAQPESDEQMPTSFGELVFTAQVTIDYSLITK